MLITAKNLASYKTHGPAIAFPLTNTVTLAVPLMEPWGSVPWTHCCLARAGVGDLCRYLLFIPREDWCGQNSGF